MPNKIALDQTRPRREGHPCTLRSLWVCMSPDVTGDDDDDDGNELDDNVMQAEVRAFDATFRIACWRLSVTISISDSIN